MLETTSFGNKGNAVKRSADQATAANAGAQNGAWSAG